MGYIKNSVQHPKARYLPTLPLQICPSPHPHKQCVSPLLSPFPLSQLSYPPQTLPLKTVASALFTVNVKAAVTGRVASSSLASLVMGIVEGKWRMVIVEFGLQGREELGNGCREVVKDQQCLR